MKLVDILARELKVWPGNYLDVGQADEGSLHLPGIGQHERHTVETYTKGDDWFSAIVTRAQWQAAVDALKDDKVVEWNGEGLPPVGADVEMFAGYSHPRFDRFIGQKVHIVAHDVINGDPVAIFRMPVDGDDTEQDYHAMVAGSFRPIRTPEQIAAEEREAELRRMYDIACQPHAETLMANLRLLYEAGYRKFEIVDN